MSRRTSRNLGEGARQKFSDRVGRDGISGFTGELSCMATMARKYKVETFSFPVASIYLVLSPGSYDPLSALSNEIVINIAMKKS